MVNEEMFKAADGSELFPRAKMPSANRFHGSMTGLAVGDALGAIVEFQLPGTFEPVTGFRRSIAHDIPVGAFTDDTSTMLCLAWSLLENDLENNAEDQMQRYVDWYRNGYKSSTSECFDIGVGTRKALEAFEATGDPLQGVQLPSTGGAGALARLAPIAISRRWGDYVIKSAVQSSLTTHGAPEAVDAARWFSALLSWAAWSSGRLAPEDSARLKRELLSERMPLDRFGLGSHQWHEGMLPIINGSYKSLRADDCEDNGYVLTALESALWALWTTDTFEDGMLSAVNLGRDADTRCAIYGQLAGAIYGIDNIPQEWRDQLVMEEEIRGVTHALAITMLRQFQQFQEEMLL